MPEGSGIGIVERAVLESLDRLGARSDRPYVKCSRIVQSLADEHGVSPKYGYDALCTLAQPWLLNLPLVDGHGNFGSPDENDGPASPRYTEARLSTAGTLALAAERGSGPRVPVGLVNGDLHVDGLAPPFSPTRVIATLLSLAGDPAVSDEEIVQRVGPPASPTGCDMGCDLAVLAAGTATAMTLTAHLAIEAHDSGAVIVLSQLPLGVGGETIVRAIANRMDRWRKEEGDELALPIRDIRNESYGDITRIVCVPRPEAAIDVCEQRIASTWGVRIRREVKLRAPLAQLMRELVDKDTAAQRATLAALTS